jgi:aspartate-semialdehyde dehydrogenase
MGRLKVAVLGCTGIVGQQFIRMLDAHPYFEISVLTSSPGSAGKMYGEAVDWVVGGDIPKSVEETIVAETSVEALLSKEITVVFSALPSAVAKKIERDLAEQGFFLFSNASAHRLMPNVPVLIPEVNPEHFELVRDQTRESKGFIVTNSNCSTAGLVLGVKPLLGFGLRSVTVTTFQALSGAGRRGIASLDIVGNIIPYIKEEEEKIERETKKILGRRHLSRVEDADIEVNASCCRVPIRDGHLESVVVELDEDVGVETVTSSLYSYRGIPQELDLPSAPEIPIIVRAEEDRPQPFRDRKAGAPGRARGMAITVGRIRKKGEKINFFLLVHNLIRGAAGTCILNAEYALMKGYMGRIRRLR